MRNWACMINWPPGLGTRKASSAPKASLKKSINVAAPFTARYWVKVWNPSGIGFTVGLVGEVP